MTKPVIYLYIDDDQEDQEIFSMAIEELDFPAQLLTVESGKKALDLLRTKRVVPDYIFLDIEMPFMNGYETLAFLQQLPGLETTKIIIYTDHLPEQYDNLQNRDIVPVIKKFVHTNMLKEFLLALDMQ